MAAVTVTACNDDDSPTNSSEPGTIVEVAQSNSQFSDLVAALQSAGLVSTLQGNGPFTVFAPTNEAFANLNVDVSVLTTDQLVEILSYHVIAGNVASSDLQAEQSVDALAGGSLYITADGSVNVNGAASVTTANIEASNGTIHAIDQVLLPDDYLDIVGIVTKRYNLQSLEEAVVNAGLASTLQGDGPFTVFAPSNEAFSNVDLSGLSEQEVQDVLTYHVLPQKVLSGDISSVPLQQ